MRRRKISPGLDVISEIELAHPTKISAAERKKIAAHLNGISEIELVFRSKVKPSERAQIADSRSAYEVFMKKWNMDTIDLREEFNILFLNTNRRVVGYYRHSVGGIIATVVDPRLIIIAALEVGAVGMILAHNHPSGDLYPSTWDIQLTEKIKSAADTLDIKVHDHLIVTSEGYFSFLVRGFL